jgi:hypothetical protein
MNNHRTLLRAFGSLMVLFFVAMPLCGVELDAVGACANAFGKALTKKSFPGLASAAVYIESEVPGLSQRELVSLLNGAVRRGGFKVLQRDEELASLMEELALSYTDAMDPEFVQRAGQLSGADAIFVCSAYTDARNSRTFLLSVKGVEVKTGALFFAEVFDRTEPAAFNVNLGYNIILVDQLSYHTIAKIDNPTQPDYVLDQKSNMKLPFQFDLSLSYHHRRSGLEISLGVCNNAVLGFQNLDEEDVYVNDVLYDHFSGGNMQSIFLTFLPTVDIGFPVTALFDPGNDVVRGSLGASLNGFELSSSPIEATVNSAYQGTDNLEEYHEESRETFNNVYAPIIRSYLIVSPVRGVALTIGAQFHLPFENDSFKIPDDIRAADGLSVKQKNDFGYVITAGMRFSLF